VSVDDKRALCPTFSGMGHGIRVLGQWTLDSSVFSTLGSGETHSGGGRLTRNLHTHDNKLGTDGRCCEPNRWHASTLVHLLFCRY
jgi:hypothetical protein